MVSAVCFVSCVLVFPGVLSAVLCLLLVSVPVFYVPVYSSVCVPCGLALSLSTCPGTLVYLPLRCCSSCLCTVFTCGVRVPVFCVLLLVSCAVLVFSTVSCVPVSGLCLSCDLSVPSAVCLSCLLPVLFTWSVLLTVVLVACVCAGFDPAVVVSCRVLCRSVCGCFMCVSVLFSVVGVCVFVLC